MQALSASLMIVMAKIQRRVWLSPLMRSNPKLRKYPSNPFVAGVWAFQQCIPAEILFYVYHALVEDPQTCYTTRWD